MTERISTNIESNRCITSASNEIEPNKTQFQNHFDYVLNRYKGENFKKAIRNSPEVTVEDLKSSTIWEASSNYVTDTGSFVSDILYNNSGSYIGSAFSSGTSSVFRGEFIQSNFYDKRDKEDSDFVGHSIILSALAMRRPKTISILAKNKNDTFFQELVVNLSAVYTNDECVIDMYSDISQLPLSYDIYRIVIHDIERVSVVSSQSVVISGVRFVAWLSASSYIDNFYVFNLKENRKMWLSADNSYDNSGNALVQKSYYGSTEVIGEWIQFSEYEKSPYNDKIYLGDFLKLTSNGSGYAKPKRISILLSNTNTFSNSNNLAILSSSLEYNFEGYTHSDIVNPKIDLLSSSYKYTRVIFETISTDIYSNVRLDDVEFILSLIHI